jgi:hypothetical protein
MTNACSTVPLAKRFFGVLAVMFSAAIFCYAAETPRTGVSVDFSHGPLAVSSDGHNLVHADGTPFVYIGCTGWELFARLTKEDAEKYLENRRQKGFTAIQCVIIAEYEDNKTPNRYNQLPLVDKDPTKPNEEYFTHVDRVIDKGAEKGLCMVVLPTWGGWVVPRPADLTNGYGKIFTTEDQCYGYGHFLGDRYKNRKNIIWCLGGDRQAVNDFIAVEKFDSRPFWRAMAEGIADGTNGANGRDGQADYSTTCMTFHEYVLSTNYFGNDVWLDLNMWGSYLLRQDDPRAYNEADSAWNIPKPLPNLNGEPAYEDHPINMNPSNGYFNDFDVRQIAYWSILAGASGHTYGCHAIWQFYSPDKTAIAAPLHYWNESLDLPGAWDMMHLRNLLESRPILERAPDKTLVSAGQETGPGHIVTARGEDFLFAYVPTGKTFSIQMGKISGAKTKAWWFNPRTGESQDLGELDNNGAREFDPPGEPGRGSNDWVLVLDDAAKQYAAPGSEYFAGNKVSATPICVKQRDNVNLAMQFRSGVTFGAIGRLVDKGAIRHMQITDSRGATVAGIPKHSRGMYIAKITFVDGSSAAGTMVLLK